MRTIWNGSISFGLVNIPVGLAPATKPLRGSRTSRSGRCTASAARRSSRSAGARVHDREVGPDEIVKGWEVAKGQFVLVEDADLEALERARQSRVDRDRALRRSSSEVDPVYFDRTYFLAPAPAPAARRPYVLLLRRCARPAWPRSGGSCSAGKENLCLIRPHGDALALETLFLAEDVHSQAEIEEAVAETEVQGRRSSTSRGR